MPFSTIPLTTKAETIGFDNTSTKLPNTPITVQQALTEIDAEIDSLAATTLPFDNTVAKLPNAPTTTQKAIEELAKRVTATTQVVVERPDSDGVVQFVNAAGGDRITLINGGDVLTFPPTDPTRVLRALISAGTGTATVGGVSYPQTTTATEIAWWFDGSAWRVITPKAATLAPTAAATSDTLLLANLAADTWTDLPVSTVISSPSDFLVYLAGVQIRLSKRLNAGKWQVASSLGLSNLSIVLLG